MATRPTIAEKTCDWSVRTATHNCRPTRAATAVTGASTAGSDTRTAKRIEGLQRNSGLVGRHDHAIAAGRFGLIQRAVGSLQQVLGRRRLLASGRDADADADRSFRPGCTLHAPTESLAQHEGAFAGGLRQDDG